MTQKLAGEELAQKLSGSIRSMLKNKEFPDAYSTNQGGCADFAHAVCWENKPMRVVSICSTLSIKYWRLSATKEGRRDPDWNSEEAPTPEELGWLKASSLPQGLSWKALDAIKFHLHLCHTWMRIGNRHFDAEAPDGVDSMFELPIMKRVLVQALRDENPVLLERLKARHPGWRHAVTHEAAWALWWKAAEPSMTTGTYVTILSVHPAPVAVELRPSKPVVVSKSKAPAP